MNNKNLISIIVPVYKVEQYLDRCIKSVLNQTYQNYEVILVDDGSPDNCPQICDKYCSEHNNFSVIHKQNEGLMAAWIDGLKVANGEYISFVDSDDWIEPTFLEEMLNNIINSNSDMCICNAYRSSEKNKLFLYAFDSKISGLLNNDELETFKHNELNTLQFFRWNKLFKKEILLNNIKYCNPKVKMWEDVNIILPCVLDAKRLYVIEKPLYNYYYNEASIVNSYSPTMLTNFEYLYPQIQQALKDKGYASEKNICDFLIRMLYISAKNIILSDVKQKRKLFHYLYKSWCYKEIKKHDITTVTGKIKFFILLFKSKSYFLTSTLIKILNKKQTKNNKRG